MRGEDAGSVVLSARIASSHQKGTHRIEAAVRADKALYQGDIVGSEVWKRIRNAIGELERKTPKAGEALN